MAYDPAIPDLDHYVGDDIPAIAANFVALAPLVPHIATLVDLTALQPHIAEILNSRIVDHNLDVANPPNGYYVRWENGLQVCWWRESVSHTHPNATGPIYRSDSITWTYPASFVSAPVVVAGASNLTWASAQAIGSSSSSLISFSPDTSARTAAISAVAIGRWK